jgi:predicted transcriptional regulator
MFKMNSGDTSYVWRLTAITDISGDHDYAQAHTRFCKVTVIASPVGVVTMLNTEDSNAGAGLVGAMGGFGSICARRLGMKPQT